MIIDFDCSLNDWWLCQLKSFQWLFAIIPLLVIVVWMLPLTSWSDDQGLTSCSSALSNKLKTREDVRKYAALVKIIIWCQVWGSYQIIGFMVQLGIRTWMWNKHELEIHVDDKFANIFATGLIVVAFAGASVLLFVVGCNLISWSLESLTVLENWHTTAKLPSPEISEWELKDA